MPFPFPSLPLEETTVAGLHTAIRANDLTCRGLVEAYLRRIDAYDRHGPRLGAVLTINPGALRRADELDRAFSRTGEFAGPLHGIPVLVKDCIETAEMPTTFGSVAMSDYQPKDDAAAVRKLREAGAIVLAKTTLPDFATSWFSYSSRSGDTRNPYAPDHDPGGSSAGTAAAVAANFGAVGLGTDCGGSIRVPSSFNNLVGVRTTPGLVSRTGSSPLVLFQDTVGPMTRTAADAALVLDVLAGYDASDPYTATYAIARPPKSYMTFLAVDGLSEARVGAVTNALGSDQDPEAAAVNRVVAAALESMRGAGAEVVDVTVPDLAQRIEATSMYVDCSKHDINAFLAARPELPVHTLEEIYERKQYHPQLDLIDAIVAGPDNPEDEPGFYRRYAERERFARVLVNLMASNRLDALVYPSVQVTPPTLEGRRQWTTLTFPTNTLIASQSWLPAITVPAGFTDDGLPVGLEITAKPYDEPMLFQLGYAFEWATHHRRSPEAAPSLPEEP